MVYKLRIASICWSHHSVNLTWSCSVPVPLERNMHALWASTLNICWSTVKCNLCAKLFFLSYTLQIIALTIQESCLRRHRSWSNGPNTVSITLKPQLDFATVRSGIMFELSSLTRISTHVEVCCSGPISIFRNTSATWLKLESVTEVVMCFKLLE